MRVLIFHGYLLHGTGSNVYNAELGAALVRAGHELHLLCQDRDPFELDWVDAAGTGTPGTLVVEERALAARARPSTGPTSAACCRSTSPTATRASRRARSRSSATPSSTRYLDANVAAVREVVARARPDVALANHLVMGPAILARALGDVPYAVKIHGSALEYTSSRTRASGRTPSRAWRAPAACWSARATPPRSLWAEMDDPSLPGRTRLGPPGVDVARFAPREPDGRAGLALAALRRRALRRRAAPVAATGSSFDRDVREAVAALDTSSPGDRLVVFVGKLIASKGVELLLAAWPLVLAREPRARLIVVGFGAFRPGLERLAAQLAAGDLAAARADARRGRARAPAARRVPRAARRPTTARGGGLAIAWRSPAGSTTTSSPTCSPPPRRWRSRARSRRRSGWSPPRPRPAARCRSSPTTPGSARSPARSPRPSRRPRARGSPSRSARTPCPSSPTRSPAGSRRPDDLRAAHPRGDRRGHPRPLLLGRRRAHGHRRRPGRSRRPARTGLTCQAAVASAIAPIVDARTTSPRSRAATSSVSRPVEITAVATPR